MNDDLGAFTDLSRRLGQAAAAFEAQFLVDLARRAIRPRPGHERTASRCLMPTHGNVCRHRRGASETTLERRAAGDAQADRLGRRPDRRDAGRRADPARHGDGDREDCSPRFRPSTIDDVNPFAQLPLIVEPRLTDAKRWYVVADPAQIDGLEYAYLAGAPGPQVESQRGFGVDGVEIKVRLDFGARLCRLARLTNSGQ